MQVGRTSARGTAIAVVCAAAFLASTTASADAAQRYASPTGSGDCSTPAQACSLTTAIGGAFGSDEVIVGPGIYSVGTSLGIGGFQVHGTVGAPKPVIKTTASTGFNLGGTDSMLFDVGIEHTTGGTAPAVFASGNSQVSRVEVVSSGTACALVGFAVIRDSLCIGGSEPFESGLSFYSSSSGLGQARNVTAVGNSGLYAGTSAAGGFTVGINLRNVILHGGTSDVTTFNAVAANTTTVTAAYSNYDSISPAGTGTSNVTPAGSGTNQTAPPLFVNEAGGSYHEATGSPTIDAGATDALTGTLDVERTARPQGAAIDIGAYEYVPPPTDATPPETTIDGGPRRRTKSKRAFFTFHSNEAGSTFACTIDRKPAAPCTSPLKLKRLKKGKHTFTVVATDAAGNADATPASYRWKVKKKKRKK